MEQFDGDLCVEIGQLPCGFGRTRELIRAGLLQGEQFPPELRRHRSGGLREGLNPGLGALALKPGQHAINAIDTGSRHQADGPVRAGQAFGIHSKREAKRVSRISNFSL
jgi:hypothetical protein